MTTNVGETRHGRDGTSGNGQDPSHFKVGRPNSSPQSLAVGLRPRSPPGTWIVSKIVSTEVSTPHESTNKHRRSGVHRLAETAKRQKGSFILATNGVVDTLKREHDNTEDGHEGHG